MQKVGAGGEFPFVLLSRRRNLPVHWILETDLEKVDNLPQNGIFRIEISPQKCVNKKCNISQQIFIIIYVCVSVCVSVCLCVCPSVCVTLPFWQENPMVL